MDLSTFDLAGWSPTPGQLQAAAALTLGILGTLIVLLVIRRAAKVLAITLIGVVILLGWWGARSGLLTSFPDAIPH